MSEHTISLNLNLLEF